jgi:release factor glutamine methyltransferase
MHIAQALHEEASTPPLTRLEAQMLLLHALGRRTDDRAWLLSHGEQALTPVTHALFRSFCQRRREGEPVAYLTGHKAFYGLDLRIDRRVLDPRPDTETLVEWALTVLHHTPSPRVLDLGTGSGAIALALAQARPDAMLHAVDRSPDALDLAQHNARCLGLRVRFMQSNWFEGLPAMGQPTADGGAWTSQAFDLIVSNPPYIAAADPHLAALRHEPLEALAAGHDGLDDLKTIISGAHFYLKTGAWLLLEHGHDQSQAVQGLLHAAGFLHVASHEDLGGIARCTGGQWPGTA